MQYLSRAYNYYSGINPATLTGAIDVIAIRHVDSDGEVTLSSSPFHVRFGKLQVIRAGEKRVTLRLPNNLPAPHTAPFSMKVGETGEAFFVLETEESVPEELMTSPVVMPSGIESLIHQLPNSDPQIATSNDTTSLTQQPFGDTEKPLSNSENLGEVEFLDLNAASHNDDDDSGGPDAEGSISTPSSMLDAAASLLPAIPFISGKTSVEDGSLDPENDRVVAQQSPKTTPEDGLPVPPNPLTANPGEIADMPSRDDHLSAVAALPGMQSGNPSDALPKVPPGEGEGPIVTYGKDIVLDAAGYHKSGSTAAKMLHDTRSEPVGRRTTSEVQDSVLNSFTRDLEAAISSHHRPPLPLRATDPDVQPHAGPMPRSSDLDLPLVVRTASPARGDRATSEPPPDPPVPVSPTLDPSSTAVAMDYAWDWGRLPPHGDEAGNAQGPPRRDTLPPLEVPSNNALPLHLTGVEENPYLFVLEMDGRSHTFELALCAASIDDPAAQSSQARESAFLDSRITFQRFIEEPQVVDDPSLVLRYSLQYSTWASDYRVLRALAMYRRGIGRPGSGFSALPSLSDLGVEPAQSSGYAWSRWWRKTQTPISPPYMNPPQDALEKAVEHQIGQEQAGTEKHYAKTLRLTSDQLKQLHLKPGPNTVQFSVTSSYSGMAVCSARIFLWDSTDQIVISDIDGTITKSDALGHVYAAIGRDWTHLGIAKLYTDITNNGYRMLYLTSRAIGQADSTRGYLKSIAQGDYRLPEGPVIMSPDRLMASLHREVIMRKPELFKMACLRDIQRLFASHAQEAFFAGFGNRITDAMSYRSVGIPAAKIYTIDSTGVVKTELLQAAGHKGSYIQLNDLVNEVFPPMSTKFKPEYTDFNYWRPSIADVDLPDLTPPSPALSARSDTSSRYSVFGKITSLGRRSSRQPVLPTSNPASRPNSPLMGPAFSADDLSEPDSPNSSMPGSFEEDKARHFPAAFQQRPDLEAGKATVNDGIEYDFDNDDNFDDDLLATGEMRNVPF